MTESQNCIEFIKQHENMELYINRGLSSPRYDEIGHIWDIGYGTTAYPNGDHVTSLDRSITESEATIYLKYYIDESCAALNKLITSPLTQAQFDACLCMAYNIGIPNFANSTLLKIININPHDLITINQEFKKWVYSNHKSIRGLINRREEEIQLYKFKDEFNLYISDLNLSLPIYIDYVKWINEFN